MEINIKFMKESAYITLQKNPEEVYQRILNHPNDSFWIKEYLGFEPYESKEYSIEDFKLNLSIDMSKFSLDNGIILYETLRHLPRYILSNPRFWAWITFEKAYEVAQKMNEALNSTSVASTWLITESRKSLLLGVISRLFFIVQISVDESKKDKFELTKFLFSNMDIYKELSYRNMGMLKNVTLAILQAQKDICEKFSIPLSKQQILNMIKETSKIGSVMLLDVMTEKEIYEMILPKFLRMVVNVRE